MLLKTGSISGITTRPDKLYSVVADAIIRSAVPSGSIMFSHKDGPLFIYEPEKQ
jgi:hypothetical protein